MTVTATIGGVSYGIMTNSIQPENRVDDRDTLTISVLDTAGTALFQKYQPVVLTDSILGTIFTGIINTPTMQQILWPANQKIWQLQCVDQAYRLDKELSNWTYKNQYAGTILAHQLQTYSAADHVSAAFALRWEELMSAWAQGSLSGTVATNNTSTGNSGAGDLELVPAGSTVTFQQSSQADFNAGTTNGGLSSPATGGVTFTPTQAIQFTATNALPGLTNPSLSMKIWSGSYTIAATDTLLFDVWIADSSPQQMASIDLVLSDGTKLSASQAIVGVDVQGVGPAITNDLSGLATNQWYNRRFFLDGGGAWVGKVVNYATVSFGGSNQGNYTAYFRNIYILRGSTTTLTILSTTATATQAMPQPVQNNGYTAISCTVLTTYERHGYMYSPVFSLSTAGIVQSSSLNWTITLPNSSFTYSITATLDGFATFLPCTLNGAIPGLLPGMNLSGKNVQLVYVFDNASNDPTLTPLLSSITGTIIPSYACTKSDIVSTTTTTWSSGTLTNLNTNAHNALQLNGYARNYDDADYSNQTLYGTASPNQGVSKKQFFLTCGYTTPATDAKSRLDFAGGNWQNFIAEVDISLPASGVQNSIVYRTTGWQNNNDTYAYVATVSTTQVQLGRGTNSSSGAGSFTSIATASVALSTNQVYHMKIVISGNSHQILLNDVLLINATDSTYPNAGYLGLRTFNNSGSTQTTLFDNFGVVAALSGTWVSPAIDIHSLGSISNSQIMLQIDPAVNTSIVTFLTEISLNNGSTWTTCTNDLATPVVLTQGYFQTLPVPGLSPGTNVSSMTQVRLRLTISTSTASIGSRSGLLWADLTAISFFVIGAYSSSGTRSTAPLGYDTFVRANQSGFGTSTNQQIWAQQSGSGTAAISSDAGTITSTGGGTTVLQLGSTSTTDQSVFCRVKFGNSGSSARVIGRYSSASSGSFYSLFLSGVEIGLQKTNSGTYTTLGFANFTPTLGSYYWLHIVCQGTTISANVWSDGSSEPSGFMLSAIDNSIASGGFGVAANLATGDTATFNSFRATLYPDPALSLVNANRVANSLVNWNAILPTNTSLSVQTSVDNGVTWSTISSAGNAIPGLTLQPDATVDDYSTDDHTSYTTTNGTGGSAATWTWDTTNKRLQAVGGSKAVALYNGVTVTDVDMFVDLYQSENAGLVWRWSDASNYYVLVVTDSAASSPNTMTLNKVVAGTLTALGSSTGTFTFPTQTHHYVRVTMLGSAITCYFDGVSILTVTDASLSSGSVGVRNDTGTSYYYYLYIQPQGQDVSSATPGANTVCTKLTLTSTDPTATPQVTDMQVLLGGPTFWPGTLIPTATYNSDTSFVSSNAEDLKNQSDYFWSMADVVDSNGNYDVSFQPREATPAPWPLDENNYQIIAGQQINDIQLAGIGQVYGADLYRNRMVIKNAIATSVYDQIFVGDGKATSWTLSNPIVAAPTAWTLNGLPVSFGLQGIDTGKQYYYQIGSTSITQDSGQTVLTDTDSLEIKYSGSSIVDVTRDNLSIPGTITQSALAAITGDSGIVTAAVDVSGQNMSVAAAETYGDQLLARYGVIGVTFNFTTLRSGLHEGQQLMLYTPHFNLNKVLTLVTDVKLSQQVAPGTNGGSLWSWQISCSTGPALGSWVKLLNLGLGN